MRRKPGDQISYYRTNQKVRERIDRLLKRSNTISANLGIDSTEKEKKEAKKEQARIDAQIREIDPYFFPGDSS